jgi:23S rRNA (uracil1939-C5)-methyltransferase
MAYKNSRARRAERNNPSVNPPITLTIDSLDIEAQGVGRDETGKVVFVEGALTGERVTAIPGRSKNNWMQAALVSVQKESSQRVRPQCPHFGLGQNNCGGCKMQHLHPAAQVAIKQRTLEDNLWHLGKVKAETMLRPIEGPTWGYRYRARLSVRYVAKKGGVLVGFHERKSSYIADMNSCEILPPHVSNMLVPLRHLIASMSQPDRLPQIELAVGDEVTALVLRHMEPLTPEDVERLRDFAAKNSVQGHAIQWWLQPKGPETVHVMEATDTRQLAYTLTEYGVRMPFKPTDFTQVNHQINEVMVSQALRLLAVQKTERVIDWFCGLGNFTLPLATQAQEVLGIEGSPVLVQRANDNLQGFAAKRAGQDLASTSFVARNLFEMTPELLLQDGYADKWLVDPPREGAFALAKTLAEIHQCNLTRIVEDDDTPESVDAANVRRAEVRELLAGSTWQPPKRIVYVSCNPATLARDAGLLVHRAGYRCTHAGVINMFPHTAHVESMAVFELTS